MDHLEPLTVAQATEIIRGAPVPYRFVLDEPRTPWFRTSVAAPQLGLTTHLLNRWIRETPGLIPNAVPIVGGYNLPRDELIIFCARFFQANGQFEELKRIVGL